MNGRLSSVRKMQTVKHFLFHIGIISLDCDLETNQFIETKDEKK